LIEVPRPLPATPFDVCRRYLIVIFRPLPRCASRVFSRAQADARGATQVIDRGGQAASGDATLSQQEKNTRQMSRGAE
jgi:hypothetical protein